MTVLSVEERGDMVEELLPVAAHLAVLVHGEGGPEDVEAVLAGLTDGQRTALIVVLAGLVDPEQPMSSALGWLDSDEHGALTVPSWEDSRPLRHLVPEPELEDDETYIDQAAVIGYLHGRRVEVKPRERLAAIAAGVRRGMQFPDFDRLHRLSKGSTSTFISRLRREILERGEELPADLVAVAGKPKLSAAQVLEIREKSAAGMGDVELSLRYDLSQSTLRRVVTGDTHQEVGGPVRVKKGSGSSESSRLLVALS